jgi:hypothetical protein
MKSQSDLPRRFDLRGKEVATIAGKQVVMICRRGASGEGQARKSGASSVIFGVGVRWRQTGYGGSAIRTVVPATLTTSNHWYKW